MKEESKSVDSQTTPKDDDVKDDDVNSESGTVDPPANKQTNLEEEKEAKDDNPVGTVAATSDTKDEHDRQVDQDTKTEPEASDNESLKTKDTPEAEVSTVDEQVNARPSHQLVDGQRVKVFTIVPTIQ